MVNISDSLEEWLWLGKSPSQMILMPWHICVQGSRGRRAGGARDAGDLGGLRLPWLMDLGLNRAGSFTGGVTLIGGLNSSATHP
jgi:hypothetical protein